MEIKSYLKVANKIFLVAALFLFFFFFAAFFQSKNYEHNYVDHPTVEQELFNGPQSLNDVPSFYNSDLVQPYLIVQDLIKNIGAIKDWVYSPAIYVFPDWLISIILVILNIPNKLLPIFYAATLYTALSLSIGLVVAETYKVNHVESTLLASTLLLSEGLLALASTKVPLSYYLWGWIGSPYIHSGAVLMSIIGCFYLIRIYSTSQRLFFDVAILATLVFLSTFSDFIFAVWFVAPAIIFHTIKKKWANRKTNWAIFLGVMAPACSAIFIESITRSKTIQSRAHFTGSFDLWVRDILQIFYSADYVMAALLLANLLLIMQFFFILIKSKQSNPATDAKSLLGIIVLFALLVPLTMNVYRGIALWRYFLILGILPLLYATLAIIAFCPNTKVGKIINWICVAAMAITFYSIYPETINYIARLKSLTPLEQCLKNEGLRTGYSDYWNAKSLIFSTSRNIHLMQLSGRAPLNFNFNVEWFLTRSDSKEPVEPNFVIMENLIHDEIFGLFGAPNKVINCAGKLIWFYDRALPGF